MTSSLLLSCIAIYIAYIISSLHKEFVERGTAGENACALFSALLQYCVLVYFFMSSRDALFIVLVANNTQFKDKLYFVVSTLLCLCEFKRNIFRLRFREK